MFRYDDLYNVHPADVVVFCASPRSQLALLMTSNNEEVFGFSNLKGLLKARIPPLQISWPLHSVHCLWSIHPSFTNTLLPTKARIPLPPPRLRYQLLLGPCHWDMTPTSLSWDRPFNSRWGHWISYEELATPSGSVSLGWTRFFWSKILQTSMQGFVYSCSLSRSLLASMIHNSGRWHGTLRKIGT